MRILILIFSLTFLFQGIHGQNRITGKVTNNGNSPVPAAAIYIPEVSMMTTADSLGNYYLSNLPSGSFKIQFSFPGYGQQFLTVDFDGHPVVLDIRLKPVPVETDEITLTGGQPGTQNTNAIDIEVLKLDRLEYKTTTNVPEMLKRVPGVDMISKGNGVARPVIRGLSMSDIVVVNNGTRLENYQYSNHHPLGMDEFGIESVEIIKGPAALLYGSDAIGGLINFIREKPAPVGTIVGDHTFQYFSNARGMNNNLGIKGSTQKVFAGLRIGQKAQADFLQGGGDYAPNSRLKEYSLKLNTGFITKTGVYKLYYDFNNQNLGLVENEAIKTIIERGSTNLVWFERLNTHILSSQNKLFLGDYKLDVNSSYQSTELMHVGEVNQIEAQMRLTTISYEARLHLPSTEQSEYIVGYQGFNQTNTNLNNREFTILPNAFSLSHSLFGLAKYTVYKKLQLEAGIRYDIKSILAQETRFPSDSSNYRPALNKNYGNFSSSFGATYTISEGLFVRANLASAYRTPVLAELASMGRHELRIEIGNPNLAPENSTGSDLSLHLHKDNFTLDFSGFYNSINNYIYLTPTIETMDSIIRDYRYEQANSILYGGEAALHFHPGSVNWLHILTTFSTVTGIRRDGGYLPFIPANKLRMEARAEKEQFWFVKKAFLSIEGLTATNQMHPAADETKTQNYTLINLNLGGNIDLDGQSVSFSIGANNLLDTKYFDHLSTLKNVRLYNPGRNITVVVRIPF